MENKVRGEVILKAGSKSYVLCLSLGALAEIESELNIKDLSEVGVLLAKPNAKQIGALILALIHGGASDETDSRKAQYETTLEEVMKLPMNIKAMTKKLSEAFNASMDDEEESAGETDSNPQPQGA